ncbi:response regulator [Polaromonas sp. SM01]|uniref:response regulator n=1 Tax=Polaromonas sp. SM01 TaxID=3085630 RepID=UPI0029825438|nr:response regulator [Polaromonas sp. SM01]MDW5443320.1 response regulator [Polaromonas sp. SM01]
MALIVVVDDDETIRTLIAAALRFEGYEVVEADNGATGLALVRSRQPDLVVSDVNMPVMNGFAMLQTLRADPTIQATPVILLTSLQERENVRSGMSSGADDYLIKPLVFDELREAAATQLNKQLMRQFAQASAVDTAISAALQEQQARLTRLYENRLLAELSDKWPSAESAEDDNKLAHATVLFVDVVNFPALSEKLSNTELSTVVRQFYNHAGDTVYLFGAHHMQFVGEGLLAVFTGSSDTDTVNCSLRATRAALGLINSAHRVQGFMASHFADRALPRFEVCVGLNSGAVTLAKLLDPLRGKSQVLPVGDTVSTSLLLQKHAYQAGWKIAASAALLDEVGGSVKTGRRRRFSLPGRSSAVHGVELLGLSS